MRKGAMIPNPRREGDRCCGFAIVLIPFLASSFWIAVFGFRRALSHPCVTLYVTMKTCYSSFVSIPGLNQ